MQEAMDELQTEMSHNIGTNTSTNEKMVVANHVLQSLAGIDKNAREYLEYIKQEVVMELKLSWALAARQPRSLVQDKMES